MGILRSDRVSGLGGANAINGSVFFGRNGTTTVASGNWLTAHSDSDFNFGQGDFTIEYWFYFTGVSGSNSGAFQISNTPGGINNANGASTGGLALDYENGCIKGIGNNGWFNGTNSVAVETWNHVALVRYSGTLQIFTNGVADTSASDSQNYSLTHLAIGGYYSTSHLFQGYISNFRIVKGTAVYSAAFTPPTERLTAIDGTVLLACQSPGNILQEATGKTLDIRKVTVNDAPPMASRFAPDKGEDHGITFADNTKFDTLSYMVPPGGTTAQRGRGRGLITGGATGSPSTNVTLIKYFDIASGGITDDFGNLTAARRGIGSVASSTRGCAGGGFVAPTSPAHTVLNTIDYVTIATTANATDFGDMQQTAYSYATASNETRGLFAGGYRPNNSAVVNTIDLITIATTGNASNFGDLTRTARSFNGAESTTRGVFFGGAPSTQDTIDFVTFSTTGDATDFGNLTDGRDIIAGSSSNTRAVMGGGRTPSNSNIIDYITIASAGNATDFGDLTAANYFYGTASNNTRAVWVSDGSTNVMEFVTIATIGNASDFGDQNGTPQHLAGVTSDSHGGIS